MTLTRIGGVFLASHAPDKLAAWFRQSLGLELQSHDAESGGYALLPAADGGVSVFAIQAARPDAPRPPTGDTETEPYGRQAMMVNLAVSDLEQTIALLKKHGDTVAGPNEMEGMGRFAWTRTPDGHDIELWEPPTTPT